MIIYKTTNLVNGMFYIGQDSKNDLLYFGSGLRLKRAIKKYSRHNFKKEILEYCDNKDSLNKSEIKWIKKLNAINKGYNIAEGGEGGNLGKAVAILKSVSMKKFMKKNPLHLKGKNNPRYDSTEYKFLNYKTQKTFRGSKLDMANYISTNSSHINAVVNGSRTHHKGWILYENKNVYTEDFFIKRKSKNSKLARSKVKSNSKPHIGKHWYHNPTTNESILSKECQVGFKKGRK